MIYIRRDAEPEFWSRYRKKHPTECYDDLQNTEEGRNVRSSLRGHNFISSLMAPSGLTTGAGSIPLSC